MIRKDKKKLYFVQNVGGFPTVIKQITVSIDAKQIRYRQLMFDFDVGKPAFRIANTFFYLMDINKGQVGFAEPDGGIAPELLDAIITRKIAKQLIAGLENPALMGSLVYILLSVGLGLACGFILGKWGI